MADRDGVVFVVLAGPGLWILLMAEARLPKRGGSTPPLKHIDFPLIHTALLNHFGYIIHIIPQGFKFGP